MPTPAPPIESEAIVIPMVSNHALVGTGMGNISSVAGPMARWIRMNLIIEVGRCQRPSLPFCPFLRLGAILRGFDARRRGRDLLPLENSPRPCFRRNSLRNEALRPFAMGTSGGVQEARAADGQGVDRGVDVQDLALVQ